MHIRVETRPGPWGDPEPEAFFLGPRRLSVLDVVDRWLATDYGYFKVAADDGDLYILRLDTRSQDWQLTLFQSDRAALAPAVSAPPKPSA
jgi:hypothetical protein